MAGGYNFGPPRVDLSWVAQLADPLIEAAQNEQTARLLQQYANGQFNQAADPSRAQQLLSVGQPTGVPGPAITPAVPGPASAPAAPQGTGATGIRAAAMRGHGVMPSVSHVEAGTRIANKLVAAGIDPKVAAGVAGQFGPESGFNSANNTGDKGTAFGLAQWRGDRFTALQNVARQRGVGWQDEDAQVAHIVNELKGPYAKAYQAALAAPDVAGAAYAIAKEYERPAKWALAQSAPARQSLASRIYGNLGQGPQYAGVPGGGSPVPLPPRRPEQFAPVQVASAGPNVGYLPRRDPSNPVNAAAPSDWQTAQATPEQFDAQIQAAQSGTVGPAAPALLIPPRPSAPAGTPPTPAPVAPVAAAPVQAAPAPVAAQPARPAVSPQQQQVLMRMLANPQTRGLAMQQIQQLSASPYNFQVVGENLIRTNARSGTAEVVPGLGKPTPWQHFQTQDGRQIAFNPLTLDTRVLDAGGGGWRPMSPQERAAYQIPENTGAAMGPDGKPVALPGTANANKPADAYDVKMGEAYAKNMQEIQAAGRSATATKNALSLMDRLTREPDFYSGFRGDTALSFKRALVALGVSNPNAASATEGFSGLANDVVLGKLGGSLGPGVSNADVTFIKQAAPDLTHTPEGNRLIIQFTTRMADRQQKIAEMARDYSRAHNGRLDIGFEDVLADYAEKNRLFTEGDFKAAQEAARGAPAPEPQRPSPKVAPVEMDGYKIRRLD
jgi:hypothetical protein